MAECKIADMQESKQRMRTYISQGTDVKTVTILGGSEEQVEAECLNAFAWHWNRYSEIVGTI